VDLGSAFLQFVIAAALVSVLDLAWLNLIAKELYRKAGADRFAENADSRLAILFYVVFIAGLVYFVIYPAIDHGSIGDTVVRGVVYGLVAFALWDVVNVVLLDRFPAKMVPVDLIWGMVLAAATAAGTYSVWHAFS
jgi:uncharacterized membrane protein